MTNETSDCVPQGVECNVLSCVQIWSQLFGAFKTKSSNRRTVITSLTDVLSYLLGGGTPITARIESQTHNHAALIGGSGTSLMSKVSFYCCTYHTSVL